MKHETYHNHHDNKAPSILFINKKRTTTTDPGDWGYTEYCGSKSSGLSNSVIMVADMLTQHGYDVAVEEAIDNNCIDRLVTLHKPDCVIIEALWVVPSKFPVLIKLHPNVKWIVRLHSEVPFIAAEGMAMGWIKEYAEMSPAVTIAANSMRIRNTLEQLLDVRIAYLPNFYNCEYDFSQKRWDKSTINISCFGAIRPLKNHLTQAIAAIRYADRNGVKLRFHINGTRVEGNAGPVLKNLRQLFANDSQHTLVEHGWYPHDVFKQMIRDEIDIGMQVSFTETYNIVAADHVDCGVSVVASDEVAFIAWPFIADPNDVNSMVTALERCVRYRKLHVNKLNNFKLDGLNDQTVGAWVKFIRKL